MAGILDLLGAMQNGVVAIQTVAKNLASVFPNSTLSSTAAPATTGSITFTSSEAAGFMIVQTSSGGTVKVPFYSNP
jgi:hypothetical protein